MSPKKRRAGASTRKGPTRPRPPVGRDDLILRVRYEGLLTPGSSTSDGPLKQVALPARPVPAESPPTTPATGGYAQEGLCATAWLEVAPQRPAPRAVHFTGRRSASEDSEGEPVKFSRVVVVPDLPDDVGRVSVSAMVTGVAEGSWEVTAVELEERASAELWPIAGRQPQAAAVATGFAVLQHAPGVRQWGWPALVALGVAAALSVQSVVVRSSGGDVSVALAVAGLATLVGYVSAKTYYMVQHRIPPSGAVRAGTCIQGFLLGAFTTLVAGGALTTTEPLELMDATAPGVLLAMAIGRPGCWLGGCCAGRPTSSRFGLWSSDRVLGVRRVPVQLLEAALALALAAVSLAVALEGVKPAGALTVAAFAAYTTGRQVLFPWRAQARRSTPKRVAALWSSAALSVAAAVAVALL